MWSLNEWCNCMLWLVVLKTVIALEHECDFIVSIKFGNMMYYVPQKHNMVTYVPQEHNLEPPLMVLAYAYIHCDVMECVACLILVLLNVLVA
jgi:hypothetical protein